MNILLIHGLGRTPLSMWGMAGTLRKAGHTPRFFGYTSVLQTFDQIVSALRDNLQQLSADGSYGIVSHSLGGVLTRAALANASFSLPAHVVMLAPPNQSPRVGQLASRRLLFRWFSGQSGQNLASSDFYRQLPTLSCPYTLIAGTAGLKGPLSLFGEVENDLILSVEEVKMRPQDVPLQVPALHSFIMNDRRAQALTVSAFSAQ